MTRHWIAALILMGGLQATAPAQAPQAEMHLEKYEAALAAAADADLQGDTARALGNRRAAEEHLEDAREAYEAAGAAGTEDVDVLQGYAQVLHLLDAYDLAAEVLARAVSLQPEDALLWARLGLNRARVGEAMRDDAFDALNQALSLAAEGEAALLAQRTLGNLYWEAGLYEFAGEAYDAALQAAPDDVAVQIWRAVLQVRRGALLEASATLDRLGREAQPYDVETRLRLRQALRDFEFYRYKFPDTAEQHAAFGKLLYRAARIPEAAVAVEHALSLAPEQPDLWNFLAAMRSQLGDMQGSIDAYSQSLEYNPDQPNVQGALEQLRQMLRGLQQQQQQQSQQQDDQSGIPPLLRAPEAE